MPLTVLVNVALKPGRFDPYAGLTKPRHFAQLEAYKAGATLNLWRGTCPHNWYLERFAGDSDCNLIITGDSETNEFHDIPRYGDGSQKVFQRLGKLTYEDPHRIPGSFAHRDGGQSWKQTWVFDHTLVARLEREWAEVKAAQAARRELPPLTHVDLSQLSDLAMSLLRLLKRTEVYPYPELLAPLQELDEQGLLQISDNACMMLRTDAQALRIPRGMAVKLRWPKGRYRSYRWVEEDLEAATQAAPRAPSSYWDAVRSLEKTPANA